MLIDEDDDNTPVSQQLTQKSKKGKEAVRNDKVLITNQTKPSISKTSLDGESSDDDDTDTSGNSYHLIIFI